MGSENKTKFQYILKIKNQIPKTLLLPINQPTTIHNSTTNNTLHKQQLKQYMKTPKIYLISKQ